MRNWALYNQEAFERDVLRDFCRAAEQLREQFDRFEASGSLSFSVLRAMVGEPLNKGLLWRLKDKSHHIFLNIPAVRPAGVMLDWTMGYIFHESLKLMEDAHQRQYYAPQLGRLAGFERNPELDTIASTLQAILEQTSESMRREVARLDTLLLQSCKLFCLYFEACGKHRPLARLLYDSNDLVRKIFQDEYSDLIRSVYGEAPERMYIEAAHSLLESARTEAADCAANAALEANPHNPDAIEVQALIRKEAESGAPLH